MDDVVRGRLKVLFVSPERLTSASFRRMFIPRWNPETRVKERHFPTVSLLCVDEAHCMSQWAHNFRPSYLRMQTMMELIQPESVLAITATAGPRVVEDICRTLSITGGTADSSVAGALRSDDTSGGVRVMKSDRDNIDVSSLILTNQEERLSKVNQMIHRDSRRYEFHLLTLFSSIVLILCTAD
jgi:superfamily II DNA helicase RecQ